MIGVAPIVRRYKGKRMIQDSRTQVRTVMCIAMMSAIQCNPVFKTTYDRLLAAGHTKTLRHCYHAPLTPKAPTLPKALCHKH